MDFKNVKDHESRYKINQLGIIISKEILIKSKNGTIRKKKEKELKPTIDKYGYAYVRICADGDKFKNKFVHRLMAINFIPNPKNYPIINHIDGDKSNNSISNLEWSTFSKNITHAYDIGLRKIGSEIKQSKISKEKAIAIKRLFRLNPKFDKYKVARKLNVSAGSIYDIIKGRSWKRV